ncbi:MAG: ATP-binding protein [Acidobacteriota bacterium]|nr:ATP-binding protein [Acidobacteriota bacterium]
MGSRAQLSIGSRIDNVELAHLVVEETLAGLQMALSSAYEIAMAAREAVANAIHHGNGEDPEKRVVVDVGVEGDEVTVKVADEGAGFDLQSVRDPLSGENLMRSGGRGLLLMHRFMDEIDYTFGADGGTIVTLRKRLQEAGERVSEEEERE